MTSRTHTTRVIGVTALSLWVMLACYAAFTLYLLRFYQPKIVADYGHGALGTLGEAVYWALAPVWAYNSVVVPLWVIASVGATLIWRSRRVGKSNHAFKRTVRT